MLSSCPSSVSYKRSFWHLPRVRAVRIHRKEALKERPKCKRPVACASTPPRIARRGNVGNVWNRSWEYERTVHRGNVHSGRHDREPGGEQDAKLGRRGTFLPFVRGSQNRYTPASASFACICLVSLVYRVKNAGINI